MARSRRESTAQASIDDATGTTTLSTSTQVDLRGCTRAVAWVNVNGLTTSCTVKILGTMTEDSTDLEQHVEYASLDFTADGSREVLIEDPAHFGNARVSAYSTGGTINVDFYEIEEHR